MICATMAVAAVGTNRPVMAEYARDARVARVVAIVIDTFLFAFVSLVINNVYGVTQVTSGAPLQVGESIAAFSTSTSVAWPWLALVAMAYFMIAEAMFGATPGKRLMRLRVVHVDGRPLTVGAAVIRNLFRPLDYLPAFYLVGGFAVLITRGSQRLGDLAARSTVVYRHRAAAPGATRTSSRSARRALWFGIVAAVIITVAFDYFGRPGLVVQGLQNTQAIGTSSDRPVVLGSPQWSWGQVTYPVEGAHGVRCHGTLTLDWDWLAGWQLGQAGWACSSLS